MADARHNPHDRALSGRRRHRRGRAHRRQISAERLHQTIIVENRGGANGQIGLQALKQSAPDGYTMAMTSDSPMTVNKWVYKIIPYDPMKDFIHVTSVIRLPSLLAVHPSLPVHNVAELIKLAKEKPGMLNYASAGVGNFSHLEAELFAQAAGIKLVHVPYKGTGPSSLALIAGEVQMSFNNVSTLWPYVKEKKLVALAVMEPKRMPDLPDVPAIAETHPRLRHGAVGRHHPARRRAQADRRPPDHGNPRGDEGACGGQDLHRSATGGDDAARRAVHRADQEGFRQVGEGGEDGAY